MTPPNEQAYFGPGAPLRTVRTVPASSAAARSTLLFVAGVVVYRILLDISYEYVADVYGYQQLFYSGKTVRTEVMSWVMLAIGMPIFKRVFDDRSFSGNILSLLIIFSVIPMISVFSFRSDYDLTYVLLVCIYWALFFGAWLITKPVVFPRMFQLESGQFYIIVAIILSIAVVVFSYINTGLRLFFGVIDVYDIRAEARAFEAPFGLNYVITLADNILPVIAVFLLAQRRFFMALILCFVIFINFSITGTKQILFVPLLGFIGYYGLRDFDKTYRLLAAAVFLTLLCIADSVITGGSTMHTLFTYRVLFIPAELHFSYYDYFQIHELLYYSQSVLKSFADANQENIQFVIGEFAINEYSARANNGLFSDAYMNLGLVGILIYPIILTLLLRVIEGATTGLSPRIMFVVVIYVAFVLLGMTLTSALLTSGLLFLVPLLYSLPRSAAPAPERAEIYAVGTPRLS